MKFYLLLFAAAFGVAAAQLAKRCRLSFSPSVCFTARASAAAEAASAATPAAAAPAAAAAAAAATTEQAAAAPQQTPGKDTKDAEGSSAAGSAAPDEFDEVSEEDLQRAQEALWASAAAAAVRGHPSSTGGPPLGLIWRQQQRSLQAKQAELQGLRRRLETLLPRLVEEAEALLGALRQREAAACRAFPDLFPQLQMALQQQAAAAEKQQQLQAELQSLKLVLQQNEEKVKEATEALEEATNLRVTSRPKASLANTIAALKASKNPKS
ncbi:hypothetical protein, conserved [Eimeria tenella]|uniref:Uncharacterized protein n=1 Tax=Eimeria tenella TaxID=5802 RepID=U6KLD3_EIMTE|nr:hypothetical protein, conserved [Eimeria tenella]CDJ37626.1 hypothetical protein, conserved [Eimeria tenella]|eukprot:XP_013228464.1 hypothetical protein, conserved [Eimeria tenella]